MIKKGFAVLVVLAIAVPLAGAPALAAEPPSVIVQGNGLAAAAVAAGNVDPNVDFWPLYSQSSIDNDSSHGLSGALWPGFLLDAFFWLYGYQQFERGGMGISESQWPNPPHSSSAASSRFVLQNMADGCATIFGKDACAQGFSAVGEPPLTFASSESQSAHFRSSGFARSIDIDIPGVVTAKDASTRTNARYVGGRTIVESVFLARDVTIGTDLHIDTIEARSLAVAAGSRAESRAASTLRVLGAKLGDTPVVIDDQGMHASGDRATDDLNGALAPQGIEVRTGLGRSNVDQSGEFVDAATGGLFIKLFRERAQEAFPAPLVEQKDEACAAAANNPLNEEITRIRVDEPNPLYGQLPIPGMPQRAQIEQSVPPPLQCPFLNRNFGVTLALGFTEASARLSPLPEIAIEGPSLGEEIAAIPPTTRTVFIPGAAAILQSPEQLPQQGAVLAAGAPRADDDGARRLQALYGLFALVVAIGVAGRFLLKFASAP